MAAGAALDLGGQAEERGEADHVIRGSAGCAGGGGGCRKKQRVRGWAVTSSGCGKKGEGVFFFPSLPSLSLFLSLFFCTRACW